MSACSVDGCEKEAESRGWCGMHAQRWRRNGHLEKVRKRNVCELDGCERFVKAQRLCQTHYMRKRRFGTVDGALGEPIKEGRRPKGDGHVSHYGYRMLRIDGRTIAEHRLVMEQALGRRLYEHENVHHINGDRLDNRLENLELWSTSQPAGQRVEDKVAWAKEFLAQYSGANA